MQTLKHWLVTASMMFIFASHSSAEALREPPAQCSPEWLANHMHQVLPCFLQEKEPDFNWSIEETSSERVKTDSGQVRVIRTRIHLTSLRWQPESEDSVNNPLWKHRLTLYQPEKLASDTALLYINNGIVHPLKTDPLPPKHDDLEFSRIAGNTHSIVIDLKDVPNQYLEFPGSGPLREDRLVAYTWKRFMQDPAKNFRWPLRLPMVKAVIQAMNASQEALKRQKVSLNHFVVSGGSKRGWTTFLVAAMDPRVTAAAPMVADFVNLPEMMDHLFRVYPGGNPAIAAYMPLKPLIGTPPMTQLLAMVDPFQYRHLLSLPKYMITASGDNFIPPDSNKVFFPRLPGDKWTRVLPNQSHYIVREAPRLVSDTLESFYGAFLEGRPMATLEWQEHQQRLSIQSSLPPKSARLWQATNPLARDFRQTADNPGVSRYVDSPITFKCRQACKTSIELFTPGKGWQASFVEVRYDNAPFQNLVFTTRVFVTPDRYPENKSDVARRHQTTANIIEQKEKPIPKG